jgi:pimeloyl-ACP methyl ester carboxylesterase
VENLILMAPLVVSLDHYDPMGAWIRWNLDAIRMWWGPRWGPSVYDYYYGLIFRSYLVDQQISVDRIPPELSGIPAIYKESVFHQVRAVRDFDLRDYKFANVEHVHLMLASKEDVPVFNDQLMAWEKWASSTRSTLVELDGADHAIPDSAPAIAASLTKRMLDGDKSFGTGKIYYSKGRTLSTCADLLTLKAGSCK